MTGPVGRPTPEENYLKQPVWKLHQILCTWVCQLSSMALLNAISVVTLNTGSQSTKEVPLLTNIRGKHNTTKRGKTPWEEGTY